MLLKKEIDIFDLESIPGIGPIGAKKLEADGITNYRDILVFGYIDIANVTGMERDLAEKVVDYCKKALEEIDDQWPSEMRADELLEKRKTLDYISTGSPDIDELIGGGIEARAITEVAGKFRSGKSQMGFTVTATVASTKKKEGEKVPPHALYIDTEDTFSPERISEIVLARKFLSTPEEIKDCLSRIIVMKPTSGAHQIQIIENASHLMQELNIKVIVIDSGTALFRQTMSEMGNAGRKFRLLNRMLHILKRLAETHNIPVLFINQMYDSMDQFNPGPKQYGGNVVGHAMTYRAIVRKAGKKWVFTSIDFPNKPEEDVEFLITEAGIVNNKKKKKD